MHPTISYEAGTYGTLRLNRPEKHHAVSLEMAVQLQEILAEIKKSDIDFLVLESTGAGSFCAGGDLTDFHADLTEEEAHTALTSMRSVLQEIVKLPMPTICLLHGDAYGGGCELATACDIRLAKEGTKFGFIQSTLGILPGWGGGAILYRKVAESFAFSWLMEGQIYDASYLHEKGWLQRIIPHQDWADKEQMLAPYMAKSSRQLRLLKKQYQEIALKGDMFAQMETEVRNCASLWASDIHQAHVNAFLAE